MSLDSVLDVTFIVLNVSIHSTTKSTIIPSHSFKQEAVRVSAGLRPEDGEDEAEEEGEQEEADDGEHAPLARLVPRGRAALVRRRLRQQDRPEDNEAVDHHHEVRLDHELALQR